MVVLLTYPRGTGRVFLCKVTIIRGAEHPWDLCVLCSEFCDLCSVFLVLCSVHCSVFRVLCSVYCSVCCSVFCVLFCVLCTVHCAAQQPVSKLLSGGRNSHESRQLDSPLHITTGHQTPVQAPVGASTRGVHHQTWGHLIAQFAQYGPFSPYGHPW